MQFTVTGAEATAPSRLFATVSDTVNSSPGAAKVGTFGVSTKGPRMVDCASAVPMDA